MKSPVAREDHVRSGQQDRKLVLIVIVFVSGFIAVVKKVPSVGFLDQRQVFQGTRGIFPYEQEVRPRAVVRRANLDLRFAFAVKIAALAGHHGKWRDVAPRPIGGVAVEHRRIGAIDAVNLQLVYRHTVGGNHD